MADPKRAQVMGNIAHARNAVKLILRMGYIRDFTEEKRAGDEGKTIFIFTPVKEGGEPLRLTPYQAECYAMGCRHGYDRGLADGAKAARLERGHHDPR